VVSPGAAAFFFPDGKEAWIPDAALMTLLLLLIFAIFFPWLARRYSRAILTNDFNLNRVAELQGVRVLNVNSLANAVKPALLPGEDLRVKVIQPGKDAGQGVGYLDDGTMVVVEGGAKSIDSELDVTVTRVLQTVAGRMVFAHPRQS